MNNKHIGSNFDDFLSECGILEEVTAVAHKRIIAMQLANAMNHLRVSNNYFNLTTTKCQVRIRENLGDILL